MRSKSNIYLSIWKTCALIIGHFLPGIDQPESVAAGGLLLELYQADYRYYNLLQIYQEIPALFIVLTRSYPVTCTALHCTHIDLFIIFLGLVRAGQQ